MFKLLSIAAILLSSNLLLATQCDNPLMKDELCFKMRHLRSQIMGLGAQRELMQVNYPYLSILGKEVLFLANNINASKAGELGHPEGLEGLKSGSQTLIDLANQQDPLALAAANTIQKKCATCHNGTGPSGGRGWDKIFKHDWEQVSKNCAREGRNPYLCKSMNGMLSAYAVVLTGPNADRKSLEAVKVSTLEIARIAADLKEKKMFHGSEETMTAVETKALLTAKQAGENNEEAFTTAQEITTGCMECHSSQLMRANSTGLNLKQL
jgi:cytochrome c2